MKIINTKYGFTERDGVQREFKYTTIKWWSVFGYVVALALVTTYAVAWGVV